MSRAPTRATPAGRSYLALQKKARAEGRATDELLQLYALESFVDRLATSQHAADLVLKGGVLLAAYDLRRPTRDVDLSARNCPNDVGATVDLVQSILAQPRADDGWSFAKPSGEPIRDADEYSGVRVTVVGALEPARVSFHVDLSFGDPIAPAPQELSVPRLLGGAIQVRGYPLEMIHAEKLVTALQRGLANTRWRDFADVYLLASRHALHAETLLVALRAVAEFRRVELSPLSGSLAELAALAQPRWSAWVRRQRLQDRLPLELERVLDAVCTFADPVLTQTITEGAWDPGSSTWT